MTQPRIIEFSVAGVPMGQPRHRGRAVTPKGRKAFVQMYLPVGDKGKDGESATRAFVWKRAVAEAFKPHRPAQCWTGLVVIKIDVFLPRPKYLLRPSSPAGPIPAGCKPDNDNTEKAIWDTLTTKTKKVGSARVVTRPGLWRGDEQIHDNHTRKWYAAKGCAPGATVRIELLADEQMELDHV